MESIFRRRRALMGKKSGDWTAVYQAVEWIETTGTQYIKTDYDLGDGARIVLKACSTDSSQDSYLITTSPWSNPVMVINWYHTNKILYTYGSNNAATASYTLTANVFYTIDASSSLIINGTTKVTKVVEDFTQATKKLRLFSYNGNNSFVGKLKEVKAYDENGNVTFDGRPCYRRSDGEIGLYDTVAGTFYTNSGTGTFKKGEDL